MQSRGEGGGMRLRWIVRLVAGRGLEVIELTQKRYSDSHCHVVEQGQQAEVYTKGLASKLN